MDKKTRLTQAFDLKLPDRPPILGGWLAAPEHIQTLTGCSEDGYWSDPSRWGLEWIVNLRTRDGDLLLIFGPLAVTTTLPHGTPGDGRLPGQGVAGLFHQQHHQPGRPPGEHPDLLADRSRKPVVTLLYKPCENPACC